MKKIFILILILFPFAVFSQEVSKEAPAITGKSVSGETINLSDFKGKVVILDFWASWCGPCKLEFPYLIELYNKYSDKDFSVLAVNVDENSSNMSKFLTNFGKDVPFKIIYDGAGKFPDLYKVDALPSSFVIDKNGIVQFVHIGFTKSDKDKFVSEIEKLLGN
jgi:thiol-disulfide isomerase/thioredoxin